MTRGLPWSIIVHLTALGLLAVWGGHVPQPPLETQRILRVQLAPLPVVEPQVTQPAPEPEPTPVIPEAKPEPEPVVKDPILPPKEVPEKVERKPEPEPEPTPVVPQPVDDPPDDPPVDTAPVPAASGPAVSGTDVDFPFAWYINLIEGTVARNWKPRQLGFREGSTRHCVVHFMVGRAGQISQVTLVRSSGVSLFDREALRAVKATRLSPLPAKFPHSALGVSYTFTLKSGV